MSNALRPYDFNPDGSDPQRQMWSGAVFAAIIDVLYERKVILVVDESTGRTLINVRLGGMRTMNGTAHVQVFHDAAGGAGVWYVLRDCGPVIPAEAMPHSTLDLDETKRAARRRVHDQQLSAVAVAQDDARFGIEASGRCRGWWSALPMDERGLYLVLYEPSADAAPDEAGTRLALEVKVDQHGDCGEVRNVVTDLSARLTPLP
ncbi:hypothetical protein [Streptomyces sp. TR02-1]|uniref:hypothetical protein n=1 Tax=Streptomyces sp. TR02-1 TaxID=3385977 RepID=UPI0039A2E396